MAARSRKLAALILIVGLAVIRWGQPAVNALERTNGADAADEPRIKSIAIKGVSGPANVTGYHLYIGGGSVELQSAAGSGGELVTLSSTDPAVVSVPTSVTVPQGQTTALFDVTTGAGGRASIEATSINTVSSSPISVPNVD